MTQIRNAKEELLSAMNFITNFYNDNKYECRIHCAEISLNYMRFKLRANHTFEQYAIFMDSLDNEYDACYKDLDEEHSHKLDGLGGTIWFEDGSWIVRAFFREGQHVGRWVYNKAPQIPKDLL